jgi:hypothetical protein
MFFVFPNQLQRVMAKEIIFLINSSLTDKGIE